MKKFDWYEVKKAFDYVAYYSFIGIGLTGMVFLVILLWKLIN